jgi:predicted HicB family RNase H-like nuclease
MPNQPKTPIRTVRVGGPLWEAAQKAAAERGESVSDVVRRALAEYVLGTTDFEQWG